MEAVVEQNRIKVSAPKRARSGREWEEARARAEAYLRAWKLPDSVVEELTMMAMSCAESELEGDGNSEVSRAAIEAAERLLRSRLNEMFGGVLDPEEQGISPRERMAILSGDVADKWAAESLDAATLQKAYVEGVNAATLIQQPQRAPETHPMVMQTSLTRLPSFRMIAGWFLLIGLIVLAFILTR